MCIESEIHHCNLVRKDLKLDTLQFAFNLLHYHNSKYFRYTVRSNYIHVNGYLIVLFQVWWSTLFSHFYTYTMLRKNGKISLRAGNSAKQKKIKGSTEIKLFITVHKLLQGIPWISPIH